jgi:uncharacterized sulfatase
MKLKDRIQSFTIEDSNIIKGVGILLIAFHNFFHWSDPSARENEFEFSANGIHNLLEGIANQPLESINFLSSFWGHFGVQLFIFISGYGLMKAYQNKKISWGSFVSKRINKLWPTFFFALFLFYTIVRVFYYGYGLEPFILEAYLLKITFLSNFIPSEVFAFSGPWWFYSMIVQLYLVFPLLLKLQKKFGNGALIGVSIFSYILLLAFNPWFITNYSSLYFFFLGNIPVFSFGILLATKPSFTYNHLYGFGALIIFGLGNYFLNFWYFSHLTATILLLTVIYYTLLKGKRQSFVYKTILFYGEISMYLFAIHGFLRRPFLVLAEKTDHAILTVLWSILFILFATLVALMLKWIVKNYLKIISIASKKVKEIHSNTINFIIDSSNRLFQTGTVLLFVFLLIRVYEFLILKQHHELPEIDFYSLLDAICRDLIIGLGFLGILLIPFVLISRLSKKLTKTLIVIFINIIIILSISLIQYFDLTLTPLDRVIYAYSWESILELTNTSDFNITTILPFIITLVVFNGSLFFDKRIKYKSLFIVFISISTLVLGLAHNKFIPKERDYNSEIEFNYANNKLLFFVKDLLRYKPSEEFDLSKIGASIKSYRKVFNNRQYLSLNYPFLRKPDQGDPIGAYFNKTKNGQKPNIVFIIVESLCTPVSGPYTYKTSFTPFLDSLTQHSLYWRNNISTAERTFGVIPAIFGSLPYGEKGFLDLNLDMPEHKSLINILAKNNYKTRFYYGGWSHFNNMDTYMHLNNIDTIIDTFDPIDSIPPNENGFSWGYSDRAIFQSTFKTIPDTSQSYLSIYLTLSTHSPFIIKNEDYYMQRVLDRLKDLNTPKDEMPSYLKNQQKLATFVFFDDELRNFFNEYKKRNDFENTIFIITGDHRGIIFYRTSQIDVYHTPLIIYSPLLKKAQEFGGISSHADLAPTFINFLQDQYQIESPEEVSWLGNLLDTSKEFHSEQHMAFMRNNRDIRDYIHNEYYLATDNLYKIHDTLHLEGIENDSIKSLMKKELFDFKNLNQFFFMNISNNGGNQKEIASFNFDFENEIPDLFSKDTSSAEAYQGKHSVKLLKNKEYGSIIPNIILEEGVSRVYIKASFMVLVTDAGKQNPVIVGSVSDSTGNIAYEAIDIMNNNFGTDQKWKKISISKTLFIDKNKNSKGSVFKLYLWNNHETEMYYDNIQVQIKVKTQ